MANNDEQLKDDTKNNNTIKHLESNKDSILYLTEKNYKNLVEALTNNVMNTAAASKSNPTLSLRLSSSSTFPNLSNKNNIYRIEEPETYHNSEDDISD